MKEFNKMSSLITEWDDIPSATKHSLARQTNKSAK